MSFILEKYKTTLAQYELPLIIIIGKDIFN